METHLFYPPKAPGLSGRRYIVTTISCSYSRVILTFDRYSGRPCGRNELPPNAHTMPAFRASSTSKHTDRIDAAWAGSEEQRGWTAGQNDHFRKEVLP